MKLFLENFIYKETHFFLIKTFWNLLWKTLTKNSLFSEILFDSFFEKFKLFFLKIFI